MHRGVRASQLKGSNKKFFLEIYNARPIEPRVNSRLPVWFRESQLRHGRERWEPT